MEKGRFALLLSGLVILVGSAIFLKWIYLGQSLPNEYKTEKTLRILSYGTFISSTGPAPALVQEFEKRCQCKVEFITAGDAGLLLERLKLTQEKARFDVVIGFDQFWANKAAKDWEWDRPRVLSEKENFFVDAVKTKTWLPFVPFDYAPMTFIYRKGEVPHPPQSLKDLLKPEFKSSLSLQDPRSSSPGVQFLGWVESSEGKESARYLKNLRSSIHSVSPSWALSYGLFKKGQSRFVFSHVTSLAYHWSIENDHSYGAASFDEGHPVHVEYAGIPQGCRNCDTAQDFLDFLLEAPSQQLIAAKNFMFPAVRQAVVPEIFKGLPALKTLPLSTVMPSFALWDSAFE